MELKGAAVIIACNFMEWLFFVDMTFDVLDLIFKLDFCCNQSSLLKQMPMCWVYVLEKVYGDSWVGNQVNSALVQIIVTYSKVITAYKTIFKNLHHINSASYSSTTEFMPKIDQTWGFFLLRYSQTWFFYKEVVFRNGLK